MIPIRVQSRLEELVEQYFPALAITDLRPYPCDLDDMDVYQLEMEDGRVYWVFDDQRDLCLLNCSGLYEDLENAYDAMTQMIENAQEAEKEKITDRSLYSDR